MKRCIFEYTTGNKSSIKKEDGKKFIEEIFIATEIENEIENAIKSSNCKIKTSKVKYSTSLISGITRMYEVI